MRPDREPYTGASYYIPVRLKNLLVAEAKRRGVKPSWLLAEMLEGRGRWRP